MITLQNTMDLPTSLPLVALIFLGMTFLVILIIFLIALIIYKFREYIDNRVEEKIKEMKWIKQKK